MILFKINVLSSIIKVRVLNYYKEVLLFKKMFIYELVSLINIFANSNRKYFTLFTIQNSKIFHARLRRLHLVYGFASGKKS